MLKFKTQPLKIDHSHQIVYMTEKQAADNKYQLVKDKVQGYMTKPDGYAVNVVLHYGKYAFPYMILTDILWQSIRGFQIMYYTHHKNEEFKAMIARTYHIHQLMLPDSAGFIIPPPSNYSEILADREGLTLLKEVMEMPDADREALVQHDREEGLKVYPGADKVVIEGEEIIVRELACYIRTGCQFLIYDATTNERRERAPYLYQEAVFGIFFSCILDGDSEADAIDHTLKSMAGITKDLVEKTVNKLIV